MLQQKKSMMKPDQTPNFNYSSHLTIYAKFQNIANQHLWDFKISLTEHSKEDKFLADCTSCKRNECLEIANLGGLF